MSFSRISTLLFLAATLAACDAVAPDTQSADVARMGPDGQIAYAKTSKVSVCHARGDGSYKAIEVSSNALGAYLRHGDGTPGAVAPGGGTFDEDCQVVQEQAAFSCEVQTSDDPERGTVTTVTLTVLDFDRILSTNFGVFILSGVENIRDGDVRFTEVTYTADGQGIAVFETDFSASPLGPFTIEPTISTSFDDIDNGADEEDLASCGVFTIG